MPHQQALPTPPSSPPALGCHCLSNSVDSPSLGVSCKRGHTCGLLELASLSTFPGSIHPVGLPENSILFCYWIPLCEFTSSQWAFRLCPFFGCHSCGRVFSSLGHVPSGGIVGSYPLEAPLDRSAQSPSRVCGLFLHVLASAYRLSHCLYPSQWL